MKKEALKVVRAYIWKTAHMRVKKGFYDENTWRVLVKPEHREKIEEVMGRMYSQIKGFEPVSRASALKILMGPFSELVREKIEKGSKLQGKSVPGSREMLKQLAQDSKDVKRSVQDVFDQEDWSSQYPGIQDASADLFISGNVVDKLNHIMAPILSLVTGGSVGDPVFSFDKDTGDIKVVSKALDLIEKTEDLENLYLQLSGKSIKEASSPLRSQPDYRGDGEHPASRNIKKDST